MSRGLRIGVVLSGQLVEERIVRAGPVTIGTSLRCMLSLPIDGLPREHVLFDPALELHAMPGAKVKTVGNRGKVELGELTILFQSIALAAPMPRPQLPAELRRVSFDRKLAAIVGASLAVHAAVIAWAITRDAETLPSFAERFHDDGIDVQLPDYVDRVDPTTPTTPPTTTPAPGPGVAHEVAHQPIVAATALPPPPSAIEAQRLANILTGDDGSSGFGGMSSRQPGADLGTQIANARNTHATIGDGSHGPRVDDRMHIGDGSKLQTGEQHLTQVTRDDEHVPVRMSIVPQSHPDPDQEDIVAKIRSAYVAGLQHCYRVALKADASLEGKVTLELTVVENGRVHEPSATGVDDAVDHCMAAQMAQWHFRSPRDEATFSISLILKPGL
ncbi:MAG TPA: AgmX/PglI C-terminal domain-containing protein [Kofleriaceae bacterium]|jgi:hypothetical protein